MANPAAGASYTSQCQSATDARVVAAAAEDDFLQSDGLPGDGNSTRTFSAYRDEKVFTVIEDSTSAFSKEGERRVLSGVVKAVILTRTDEP
ncbi:hypothetical protein EV217_5049 [Phyllobacterium myrsinacearum]|nr:hypothetical protein EV217_5049 [Phyllobacterium myrsinacearum]